MADNAFIILVLGSCKTVVVRKDGKQSEVGISLLTRKILMRLVVSRMRSYYAILIEVVMLDEAVNLSIVEGYVPAEKRSLTCF